MDALLGAASQIGGINVRCDDDIIDRLNHQYTTFVIVVFAIVVSTKQYVGDPIHCWCPAHFTDNHEDFTNKICWVTNTYYLPYKQRVIPGPDDPRNHIISYYQWVPSILLVQALMFYLPCMVWRFLNSGSGIDVNNIVESSLKCQHTGFEDIRDKTLAYIVRILDRYFSSQSNNKGCCAGCKRVLSRDLCLLCGRKYGNYLIVLYLFVKILYLVNVVGQLFMLNAFLGTGYHVYGFDVLRKLLNNEDFTSSARFPRVTMCDFKVRQLGNIHPHTVQCVLPINMFNEKIFIFIWFWFVFVSIMTAINLAMWATRCIFRLDQVRYIKHHLKAFGRVNKHTDKKQVTLFVLDYLKNDGVFVMRLVSKNTNSLVVAEIVSRLWDRYSGGVPLLERGGADV